LRKIKKQYRLEAVTLAEAEAAAEEFTAEAADNGEE
jgi:hypothetical protein